MRWFVVTFTVLTALIITQHYVVNGLSKEFKMVRHQQLLIARVPEMEAVLAGVAAKKQVIRVAAPPLPKSQYNLQGMSINGNTFLTMINGAVYVKGDLIDEYVVDEITLSSTTLRNELTNEVKKLYLDQDEVKTNN